jgi:hypothetical protein
MGLIKIFSGSEILARSLKEKIEAAGVAVVLKDNIQSGVWLVLAPATSP